MPALHSDRGRAASFGSAAEQYDRFRPAYPDALIDDLAGLRPAAVLDVGCGTGKVAVALAERGLSVVGVEVDERMAAVARRHGIDVRVGAFEQWSAAGAAFDLITCGEAWHWIDPAKGVAKAAEVLTVGGTIARFWTTTALGEAACAAFDPIYRAHAPEVAQVWRPSRSSPRFHAGQPDPFRGDAAFAPTEVRAYPWERTLSTDQWVGMAATISDHRRLDPERRQSLLRSLRTAIEELGGSLRTHNETYALLNHRR